MSRSVPVEQSALDRVNRRTYASRGAVRQYGAASGWLDAGEQAAVTHAAARCAGGTVLDIGVGGGRTAPLLRALGARYCGIDYTADLLDVARRRWPDLDLRQMDARALEFPEASFDLVIFSFNGIDSVDLPGRAQILCEVRRVLKPGGSFVFSSLNRDGPAFTESVWAGDAGWHGARGLYRHARRAVLGAWHRLRLRPLIWHGADAALRPLAVHDFGVVAMFTSPRAQLRQLESAGFRVDAVFADADGERVNPDTEPVGTAWCYYVACKPQAADAVAEPAAVQ